MAERKRRGWLKADSDIDDELYSPGVRDAHKRRDELRDKIRDALRSKNRLLTGDPETGLMDLVIRAAGKRRKGDAKTDKQAAELIKKTKSPSLAVLNDMFLKDKKRMERYMSYDQIYELIPEMASAAEAMASNILSPESFGVPALGVDVGTEELMNEGERREAAARLDGLIDVHDVHRNLFDHVQDMVVYGDLFLHVMDLDAELDDLLPSQSKDKRNWLDRNASPAPVDLTEEWKALSENGRGVVFEAGDARITDPEGFLAKVRELVDDVFVVDDGGRRTASRQRRILAEASGRSRRPEGREGKKRSREDMIVGGGNVSLRKLNPRRVVKLMTANRCLGYYHVDFADEVEFGVRSYQSMRMSGNFQNFYGRQYSDQTAGDLANKRFDFFADAVAKELEGKLDKSFLKANPEFKEVVAAILRAKEFASKRVTVSFLEPREVVHFHPGGRVYGKSMYYKSVFAAMLYLATLMGAIMRGIVKSADEKVVRVIADGLDNNPEAAVATVVNDLEGRNISVDDMGDISQAMRLASAFKTFYIPVVDGQAPIEYDTISGEDPQINTEFLEYLRNAMISGTGVPQVFIGLKEEVEYARTLAMQNGVFVRATTRWQQEIADGYTELLRKLYEATWPEDELLSTSDIKATLATPASLNDRNVSESFEVTMGVVEKIAEAVAGTGDEEKLRKLKLELLKRRMPQLEWDEAEEYVRAIGLDKRQDTLEKGDAGGGGEGGGDAGGGF